MIEATPSQTRPTAAPNPLEILLALIRRARSAESVTALRFIAVNDSHLLSPYHQSALWLHGKIEALSGLTEVEANAPYAQWLTGVCKHLGGGKPRLLASTDLPADLSGDWARWLPAHALWIPFGPEASPETGGGLLLARDLPWRDIELRLFVEWMETWFTAYRALHRPNLFAGLARKLRRAPRALARKPILWSALILGALLFPVRLSVLVPGELVPANPVAIRAPLEGVIKDILVRTNDTVKTGQLLFTYDDVMLTSKLEVAAEGLRTAEAEERQFSQQALFDARARGALSGARGAVEEKRLEVDYLKGLLTRNQVVAPRDGIAFVGDPTEWIGRPVVAGQRILRIAAPDDREIEAWLPLGDAIHLAPDAPVKLYLSSSPLSPVAGKLNYVSYESLRRPDGTYAYRVRARLDGATDHRAGLKGTVRLSGDRVPFVYWMLRRPLAEAREFLGL
ncbi:MAG: efflux RND transporter periplasmic adaptor subunit [Rariglobus sp.]|nr:HlyD family efflux transporter periplasmic adaptor subunit [Rariglobus sp.]